MSTIEKTKRLLTLLVLILLSGCSSGDKKTNREDSKPTIADRTYSFVDASLGKQWREDSSGCIGARRDIAKCCGQALKQYEGAHVKEFTKLFGSPN